MSRYRILVVDDSPMVLDMVGRALRASGYDVVCAHDLNELEEAVAGAQLDLILMDVQMPEAFGDDVAMVLRLVRGVYAPIYLFSNLGPEELAERALDAECDGYISKRAGIAAMLERVEEILEGA